MARKYRYTLGIGYANARHEDIREFDDEELAGMSDEDIDLYVEEDYENWRDNFLDGGIERIS